jgi:uncharacterized membrane protein
MLKKILVLILIAVVAALLWKLVKISLSILGTIVLIVLLIWGIKCVLTGSWHD